MFRTPIRRPATLAPLLALLGQLVLVAAAAAVTGGADWPVR